MITRPHALKSAGASGINSGRAAGYYEISTRWDREGVGLPAVPKGASEGVWYVLGPGAPAIEGERGTAKDVERLLAGEDPWGGVSVQNAWAATRWMGTDWTSSADKSVSLLYATAPAEERARIEAAVRDAALTAFRHVVAPQAYGRLGHGGEEHVPVSIVVHAYNQRLSRMNDPQLHLHLLVPNIGWRRGGVGAIEERDMYAAAKAASAVATLELQTALQEAGYPIALGEDGRLHVAGLPSELEDAFAKRAEQMRDAAAQRFGPEWWSSASAAQKELIAVTTRPVHDPQYREDWAFQAEVLGVGDAWDRWAAHVAGVQQAREAEAVREPMLREELEQRLVEVVRESAKALNFHEIERGRSERLPTALFTRTDLIAETAWRAAAAGLPARAEDVLRAVEAAERQGVVVTLQAGQTAATDRITTPEMIVCERHVLDTWTLMAQTFGYGVPAQAGLVVGLSAEQRAAVAAATSDRQVGMIEGVAGAGKTTVMGVVREAYEAHGYRVIGEAMQGVAAQQVQQASGIPARTVALAEAVGRKLDHKTIVVVDEAARLGSAQLGRLISEVQQASGKVILVGDPQQLQPLQAGNAFPHLSQATRELAPESHSTIQEIRRQEHAPSEVREVSELAARGDGRGALLRADEHGLVQVHATTREAYAAAAQELAEQIETGKSTLGITATKQDARALNEAVRKELQGRGAVSSTEQMYTVHLSQRHEHRFTLAEGDSVAFAHNSYALGVRNGQRGVIVGIGSDSGDVSIRLLENPRMDRHGCVMRDAVPVEPGGLYDLQVREAEWYVRVPAKDAGHLVAHDYARTADRAQGVTVQHAAVVAHIDSARMDRQWAAVAATRERERLSFHLSVAGMERVEAPEAVSERAHWPRGADREAQAESQEHDSSTAVAARLVVSPRVRVEAIEQASQLLSRDRPGASTLDYPEAQERAREYASAAGYARDRERNGEQAREHGR